MSTRYQYILHKLFFLSLLCAFTTPLQETLAQGVGGGPSRSAVPTFTLLGKIVNAENAQPLEYATIALMKAEDSTVVNGTITNADGTFKVNVPAAGEYIATIKFLGYETKFIDGITLNRDNKQVNLKEIPIAEQTTTLDEVQITSRKSRMEFSLDKRVFNVGQDLSQLGGSASDLLDNIPSVTTDIDGNISLRGSGNVRILINGRPSGLTTADALQKLSANMIEKVEIVTNPSARYEAEGTAGIINIVLKKDRRYGWNGTIDAAAGAPASHNLAANMNFRQKKLNWFSSLGGRYRDYPRETFEHRELLDNGQITGIIDQDQQTRRANVSGIFRFGVDYSFDEQTTLTGSVMYRREDGDNRDEIEYLFFNPEYALENVSLRETFEDEDEEGLDYNLQFVRTFGSKDHKLSASVIYTSEGETEAMDATEAFYNADRVLLDRDLLQRINNAEDEEEWAINVDYQKPIGEDGKFEVGYRGGIRNIQTRYKVEEFNGETRAWETLANLTNNFDYDEDIQAFYTSYGNKIGEKFSFQAGLRAEYTHVITLLRNTNEENDRDYFNLFPSLFLNYELKPGNAFQWSYSRRIRRPRFWDLNPFFNFTNPLYFRSGNPNLDPEFTNSLELSYIRTWEKATFSSSVYHRHTDNAITRVVRLDSTGVSTSMPENLATQREMGVEFTLSMTPIKGWDVDLSSNFYRGEINGANVGFASQTVFTSWTSRLNTRMELPGKFEGQIMINYRGPENTPQGRREDFLYTDLGLARDILNERATLSFRVSNIFNTWYRYRAEGDTFSIYRQGQWRSIRQFALNFTYRINQKKGRGGSRRGGNMNFGE